MLSKLLLRLILVDLIVMETASLYRRSESSECQQSPDTCEGRFQTCDSNYNFIYTTSPTVGNSCSQQLNVTEGEDVLFDTRLEFIKQGGCQCIVKLFRVLYPSINEHIFAYVDKITTNELDFVVNKDNGRGQPLFLMLPSVNMNMNGTYHMEVEVQYQGESEVRKIWKIFQLTITSRTPVTSAASTIPITPTMKINSVTVTNTINPTTGTPVTSTAPTMPNTTMKNSITVTNTTGGLISPPGGAGRGSEAIIIGPIIGTIAASILIIVIATTFVVRKRWRTRGSSKQEFVVQERHENETLIIEENGLCQSLSVGKGRPESMIDNHDLPPNTMAQESTPVNV